MAIGKLYGKLLGERIIRCRRNYSKNIAVRYLTANGLRDKNFLYNPSVRPEVSKGKRFSTGTPFREIDGVSFALFLEQ